MLDDVLSKGDRFWKEPNVFETGDKLHIDEVNVF